MKIVAIIQARMGSTRLPGKVMRHLNNKTVLGHVIDRVKACALVDEVVVATTILKRDDVIVDESQKHKVRVFRGSEDDVLARYYEAALDAAADVIVRVTSDCPLYDPEILKKMLRQYILGRNSGEQVDYFCNFLVRSFPRGLDTEIFTFRTLEEAAENARKSYEREHVTPYISQHPQLFNLMGFKNDIDLSFHRWTLDTIEDWELISTIYERVETGSYRIFGMKEVVALFEKFPELISINAHVEQKKIEE